jgi:ABC-type multidrug transport system fused ATPase/permease subunit
MKKIFVASIILIILSTSISMAQCAMCRMTVESTVSNGRSQIASNLNVAILYLLMAPYVLTAVIGYLWWRSSKKNISPITLLRQRIRKAFNKVNMG